MDLSKVGYFTHYLSFFAILLFSTAFSLQAEGFLLHQLQQFGLYKSFMETFDAGYIKVTVWFALFLFYFMFFAAIKLIANTVLELSLFFFCKQEESPVFPTHPLGSALYLGFGAVSMVGVSSLWLLASIYLLAGLVAFALLIYKVSDRLNVPRIVGVVFMNFIFWSVFSFAVLNVVLKLYNGLLKSIGI